MKATKYTHQLTVRRERVSEPLATRKITDPSIAAAQARHFLAGLDREHFLVLPLDTKHRPIGVHICSVGTASASLVHPREVYKIAILASASAIIVAHNHPSGDLDPSPEDWAVTRRLRKAGEILGIPLLDHIIVTDHDHHSMTDDEGNRE